MLFFKTADISSLNTETAWPGFSNASKTVANAVQYGYLTSGSKGTRQLSAAGEQFVLALPDRDAAREAMAQYTKPRRKSNSKKTK